MAIFNSYVSHNQRVTINPMTIKSMKSQHHSKVWKMRGSASAQPKKVGEEHGAPVRERSVAL